MNSGSSILISDLLYWTVNDVAQTSVLWTGNLNVGDSENVTLGNFQFEETIEYEIRIWSSQPNGATDIDPTDDTLVISNFYTTLAGEFTIGGASPDFADLAAAQDALSYGGVRNSVKMLMRSGIYTEQLQLGEFFGTSDVNTVTFQSETGNAADVIIQFSPPFDNPNIVHLDGADNIRFQHLTFQILGGSTIVSALRMSNGTSNIEITNCIFTGNNNNLGIYNIYDGEHERLRITNNEFNNCSAAISLQAAGLKDVIISGNNINNSTAAGGARIGCNGLDSLIIRNNILLNTIGGSANILAYFTDNTLEIVNNKCSGIEVRNTSYIRIENNQIHGRDGLFVAGINADTQRSRIINNFISKIGGGRGLQIFSSDDINVRTISSPIKVVVWQLRA